MAGGTFPSALPTYTVANATDTAGAAGGVGLGPLLTALEVDVTAVAAKIGTGAATPTVNKVLVGSGTGTSGWSSTLSGLTFVAPVLGAATATTINNVTITQPASGATLTIPDGVTVTFPASTGTVAMLNVGNIFVANQIVQSSSANALAVGRNGSTNPAFRVNGSVASAVTGIVVTPAVAGNGAALSVASTGTNEALTVDAKGSGVINFGSVSTGAAQVNGDTIGTLTAAQTLTNKRITSRESTLTSSATPGPASDTTDIFTITAQAAGATFAAPSGTPTQGQVLVIRIKDNGTAQTLAWNAIYRPMGVALPTTTFISKTLYLGFLYNSTDTKWDLVSTAQEA